VAIYVLTTEGQMSAQSKTKKLIRVDAPLDLLVENEDNPNAMSDREFDLLVRNMDEEGWTDPSLVAPVDPAAFEMIVANHKPKNDRDAKAWDQIWASMRENKQSLRIVGGHHRVKSGRYLGLTAGPVTINPDPEFDKEQQDIQLLRHNAIKGSLDPKKFFVLYKRYEGKYGKEAMADTFGFADQQMLENLIADAEKSLPAELKQKFKEGAAEIKTVDDLEKLLNRLFTTFGDTLPTGMMFLDHMGKDSVWLRINKKTYDALVLICDQCVTNKKTVDDVVGRVLQLIATGQANALMKVVNTTTPEVAIPAGFKNKPTKMNLDLAQGVIDG
jgi:hypothetical protein